MMRAHMNGKVIVIHRTLAGYGDESHKKLGIIAWHLVPNSVP